MIDKNAKVLVTGGNGFLGSAVMDRLKSTGYKNTMTFRSLECDLKDMDSTVDLLRDFRPDAIIHLAAIVGGIGANKANPGRFAYENLVMGVNLIEAAHILNSEKPVKLIIAGTICAYPKFTPVPFKEENLWNGFPEETNAPYGLAKKMLLVLAQSYRQQYGLEFAYLLPVNLYGPKDNFDLESSHVIPAMIRKFHIAKVNQAKTVTLWGDGTPTREFLYVNDCAEAFIKAMENYSGDDPINVGSGQEISMKDLAENIKNVFVYSGEIIWDISKPNGQPRRCLDTSRAKEKIQWQSSTNFDDGLISTYNWFLANIGELHEPHD